MEKYKAPEYSKVDPDLTAFTAAKLKENSESLVYQFNHLIASEQHELENMKTKSLKLQKIFEKDVNEDYIGAVDESIQSL